MSTQQKSRTGWHTGWRPRPVTQVRSRTGWVKARPAPTKVGR